MRAAVGAFCAGGDCCIDGCLVGRAAAWATGERFGQLLDPGNVAVDCGKSICGRSGLVRLSGSYVEQRYDNRPDQSKQRSGNNSLNQTKSCHG